MLFTEDEANRIIPFPTAKVDVASSSWQETIYSPIFCNLAYCLPELAAKTCVVPVTVIETETTVADTPS